MNIPWELIWAAVLPMVTDCLKKGRSDEEVRSTLENPSWLERRRFERALRIELGMSLREWARDGDEIMQSAWNQVNQAKNPGMAGGANPIDDLIIQARQDI